MGSRYLSSEGDSDNISELKKDEEELQTLERNLMSVMRPIARGVFTNTTSTIQRGAKEKTAALVRASSVDMILVIHEILVAADKYHCVSALRPLAVGWARLCKHISKEGFVCFQDDHATCVAIFVWVAFHLGLYNVYQVTTDYLVARFPSELSGKLNYELLPGGLKSEPFYSQTKYHEKQKLSPDRRDHAGYLANLAPSSHRHSA